jgi:hypothetical protein
MILVNLPVYINVISYLTIVYNKPIHTGLDINVCPISVKTDVGQVDLVSRLSDVTSEKMTVLPFEGYFL